MYCKVDDLESQRSTSSRAVKVGIAVIGGSCLVFLTVMAMSTSRPMLHTTSAAESTSLFGLPASSRLTNRPSPVLPQNLANLLPGPSPLKELALAKIEANNRCNRDVTMSANRAQAVLASSTNMTGIKTAKDLKAGIVAPLGFFDPLGLSTKLSTGRLLYFREAELKHGRVCMLAALGFAVGEKFHPLFGGNIDVPSYIAFQETPLQTFWGLVLLAIGIPELVYGVPTFKLGLKGDETWSLKEDRLPGDFGFDPLGMKPKKPNDLLDLQNKEILNGRLAMIATAGMVAQELVTGKKLFD